MLELLLWLKQFKNHYSFHNMKENMSSKSGDADTAAAVEFGEILETLNIEESYLPEDIIFIYR